MFPRFHNRHILSYQESNATLSATYNEKTNEAPDFTWVKSGTRNTLGFRLDSFSNTVSSIAITNVSLGFIGIREPFLLATIGTDTNNHHLWRLTGPSGYNYRVESSTNLVNWETRAVLVNTNGTVNFTDPGSTNTNRRFYRAVTP